MSSTRDATRHATKNRLLSLLLVPVALLPQGCVTAEMWDRLDRSRGGRVAAVALTPVTVAVDAAVIAVVAAAYVCPSSNAQNGGCGR